MFRRRLCCCGASGCGADVTDCEDTELTIIYIDKDATGREDGNNWANAYTTINAALATGSGYRYYIMGHGQSDPYVENISVLDDYQFIGRGSVWISGRFAVRHGNCIKSINVDGTGITPATVSLVYCGVGNVYMNCTVYGAGTPGDGWHGFWSGSADVATVLINRFYNCKAINCITSGFLAYNQCYMCSCEADNCGIGFYIWHNQRTPDLTGYYECYAHDCNVGFSVIPSAERIDFRECVAVDNASYGFYDLGGSYSYSNKYDSCVSRSNGDDGFYSVSGDPNIHSTCVSDGNAGHGYFGAGGVAEFTDCDSLNNSLCGYYNADLASGNTASGNGAGCDPGDYCDGSTDPCGVCEECP